MVPIQAGYKASDLGGDELTATDIYELNSAYQCPNTPANPGCPELVNTWQNKRWVMDKEVQFNVSTLS